MIDIESTYTAATFTALRRCMESKRLAAEAKHDEAARAEAQCTAARRLCSHIKSAWDGTLAEVDLDLVADLAEEAGVPLSGFTQDDFDAQFEAIQEMAASELKREEKSALSC